MKKFLAVLSLAVVLGLGLGVPTTPAEAAYPQVSTKLTSSQTSSSTSRLKIGSSGLHILVGNYNSSKTIRWTIFKNGNAWTSGLVSAGQTYNYQFSASSISSGEYSLRLYCGKTGSNTGCSGTGALTAK